MAQLRRAAIYNENNGITPRTKINVSQSAKKIFGERKNILSAENCGLTPHLKSNNTHSIKKVFGEQRNVNFNENEGVTPRIKSKGLQSAKKVFAERQNVTQSNDILPKAEVKEHVKTKLVQQNLPVAEELAIEKEVFDFSKPCCLKTPKQPLEEVWAEMNMLDDAMINNLLKVAFDNSKENLEPITPPPVFLDHDDDMPKYDLKSLQSLQFGENIDYDDDLIPKLEMPRI